MTNSKLYVVGSITVDLYFQGSSLNTNFGKFELSIGGKYQVDKFATRIGGGGANVAITAKRMGISTTLISVIGQNSFSNLIRDDLNRYGISDKYIISCENYNNISTILLSQDGERTVLNYRTPHCQQKKMREVLERLENGHLVSWIYFGGHLPDLSLADKAILFHSLRAHKIKIALNLSRAECEAGYEALSPLLAQTDLLIQNAHEFSNILGKNYESVDLSQNHLSHLPAFMGDLVITDAQNGSFAYSGDKVYKQKAIVPQQIIDTTGAGDAFSGAYLAQIMQGSTIPDALLSASTYVSKKLATFGAH